LYCFCIFSNKLDLNQETSFYYSCAYFRFAKCRGANETSKFLSHEFNFNFWRNAVRERRPPFEPQNFNKTLKLFKPLLRLRSRNLKQKTRREKAWLKWKFKRHGTWHNGTQHNDTQHNNDKCDTHNNITLNYKKMWQPA
jgi:hypothetical protein